MICFDEVATTKAYSTRSLKQLVVLENDEAGPTITSLDEAAFTHNAYSDIDGRLTNDAVMISSHYMRWIITALQMLSLQMLFPATV